MSKKICAVLAVIMMLTLSMPTYVFAVGSVTVSDTDALAEALADNSITDVIIPGGTTLLTTDTNKSLTIPSGKTVTLDSGGYFMTLSCPVVNNGTIINNNGSMSSYTTITNASTGAINNSAYFYNGGTIQNQGTISNARTFVNNSGATITNNGTFTNSGTWTNNGSFSGNDIVADTPVELINGSVVTYYPTFQEALNQINNTGYELRVLKDLTLEGSVTLPIVPFTLSGMKPDGGISTLTIDNGDFALRADATLKNINLAHTGSSGNFDIYWQINSTVWYDYALTVQSGVTFSDLNIAGHASTLNVQGTLDMGSKSITGIQNVNLIGGTLKVGSLQTSNLSLSNGSTLDITGAEGLTVAGTLTSGGTKTNTLSLPAPSDHGGTVYSAMLANTTVNSTSAFKIIPTAGASFASKCNLIYLNNTVAGDNAFVSGVSGLTTATRTIDGKQYLTLINSTSMALTSDTPSITYGDSSFTLTATVKDAANAAVTSGTVKFYKGTSAVESNLLATVGVDGGGNAQCFVDAAVNAAVGDNGFYALYEDSADNYSPSSGTVTVPMNKKSLSLNSVKVANKSYDGTTAASITEITLNTSGILSGDTVDVSATAAFQDADVGTGKAVDLKDIQLSGADAGNYTIASTASNAATADITQATPAVQLSAAPVTGAVSGDTVTLTATVTGAASGAFPSGTVTFYSGTTELGMGNCSGGQATFVWSNVPVETYSLSAQYAGDAYYIAAVSDAGSYIVGKKGQDALSVNGVPAGTIHYGDSPFTLTTTGGSGAGAIDYTVKSGTSVTVDASTGVVTITSAGTSVITVTKAGTADYEEAATDVTVDVAASPIGLASVKVSNKSYDGTTAASITEITLNTSGILSGDIVDVSATAAFQDTDVGTGKAVGLKDIQLSGTDAGNYTIASTASNVTTADITQATPTVQLSAAPTTGAVSGNTVTLTATVTGAASGASPSGAVTFYSGTTALGTGTCSGGQAVFTWSSVPVGTYSLSAQYPGDVNYVAAISDAGSYAVGKKDQDALSVNGLPIGTIHYGDPSFMLTATGGSGAGEINYAVKSGTSVTVDASTGVVTITSAGTSVITVTKAGTADYESAATDVTVEVAAKLLSLNSVKVSSKTYDGTTAASIAEITLNTSGLLSGDTVDVSATAAFRDADVGTGKAVDLTNIQLSGADAGKYTIASTASNVTTADITQATPAVQLSASPATGAVSGDTVTLTANVTGASAGTSPSGTVTFYNGTTALGTGNCSGGQAVFTWSSVPAGTYSLSTQYSGDANYKAATSVRSSYTISAKTPTSPSGGNSPSGSSTTDTPKTPESATATAAATVTDGKATASVSVSQMSDALKQAQTAAGTTGTSEVQIQVSGASGASSVAATIPGTSMQALVSGDVGGLTISSDLGSVTFGEDALKTITDAGSGDVTVSVGKSDTSALSDVVKQAIGDRPVYQFFVTNGTGMVSQFGGTVVASVPYTLAAGEDPSAIVLYYVNAAGELETITNGHYDSSTGKVVFETNHFSTYAVGYNKVDFSDVADTAWYADAVTFLAARGVTSGTTSMTFGPNATLTRGQFITLLLKAYNVVAVTNAAGNFSDAGDTYFTGYLAAAKKLGITNGVGDNRFAPERTITRQEMFTLLYNALKVLEKLPEGSSGKTLSDFKDSDSVASYAQEAISYLVKTGVVGGNNGSLLPQSTTTRAQMAQVLYNLLSK